MNGPTPADIAQENLIRVHAAEIDCSCVMCSDSMTISVARVQEHRGAVLCPVCHRKFYPASDDASTVLAKD